MGVSEDFVANGGLVVTTEEVGFGTQVGGAEEALDEFQLQVTNSRKWKRLKHPCMHDKLKIGS